MGRVGGSKIPKILYTRLNGSLSKLVVSKYDILFINKKFKQPLF